MAHGRSIDGYVKKLIASVQMEHDGWSASKVQEEVVSMLEVAGYRRKGPSWPSLSAVQKLLQLYSSRIEELQEAPDDRPWSVLAMSSSGIQSEALSPVLEAWGRTIDEGPALTIREARWVARLCSVLKDRSKLLACARYYASAERLAQITGSYPEDEEQATMAWIDDLKLLRDTGLMDVSALDRRLEEVVKRSPLPSTTTTLEMYRVGLSQRPATPPARKTRDHRRDGADEDSTV